MDRTGTETWTSDADSSRTSGISQHRAFCNACWWSKLKFKSQDRLLILLLPFLWGLSASKSDQKWILMAPSGFVGPSFRYAKHMFHLEMCAQHFCGRGRKKIRLTCFWLSIEALSDPKIHAFGKWALSSASLLPLQFNSLTCTSMFGAGGKSLNIYRVKNSR